MDFQWISLLEVLSRAEVNLDGLAQPEQHHTSVASGAICRKVMIKSELPSLMANYGKIKGVEPLRSRIAMAVEGNGKLEE